MLYNLDSVIVIYAVDGVPVNQQRAANHPANLEQAGHRFAISELTRTECLVPTFAPISAQKFSDFFDFFHGTNLHTLPLTASMFLRASAIRGGYSYATTGTAHPKRYSLPDALHLAAAIESGCDVFLTNDSRLAGFPDIKVEILP